MNRRSSAVVVAFVLLVACGLAASFVSLPYARFSPGPSLNILGDEADGKPIISVTGHKTYKTSGEFRMTTVSSTRRDAHMTVWEALKAWVDPDEQLYPYDVIFPDNQQTREDDVAEAAAEMVSSQEHAVAAALKELGIKSTTKPAVLSVSSGSAADGNLKARDIFVSVNGQPITESKQVADLVGPLKPGSKVQIDVLRNGKPRSFELVTKPNPEDASRSLIGIQLGLAYDFPFQVTVQIPERIGGPSAGLIFSLGIYDTLTPGELTGGKRIAGTGEILDDGTVGPIGGIQQKIAGAEADGAQAFLVPPDNCDAAVIAKTDMELIRADTMHDAVEAIKALVAGKTGDLPRCPSPDKGAS